MKSRFPRRMIALTALCPFVLFGFNARTTTADEPASKLLEHRFTDVVQPFVKNYCLDCHGATKHEAKLDLSGFTSPASLVKGHRVWDRVIERLEAEEMPPAKAAKQPKA